MSDSVDRVFVHALNTVKRIPRTGTARPPTAERLKLYGLYKQSMEGDVEGVMHRPVGNTTDVYAECEKWDAWFAQRGVSRTEAKRRYISTLIETMHCYASQTPEARELVAELEFVWDQIKTNTAHLPLSSPSSPGSGSHGMSHTQRVGVPPLSPPEVRQSQLQAYSQSRLLQHQQQQQQQQRGYANIGGRLAQPYEDMVAIATANNGRGESSRLRVLSPVSQPDEIYQRRGRRMQDYEDNGSQGQHLDDEDEDEEEEQYEEAQDTLYDENDDNDQHHSKHTSDEELNQDGEDSSSSVQQHHGSKPSHSNHNNNDSTRKRSKTSDTRRWRRRVEQALTKMTAEIAAVREQMETRAIQQRRRNSAWAWVKWLAWITLRQVLWDLAVLAMLLIWMRKIGRAHV